MTIGAHVPSPPKPGVKDHETVEVGDAVAIMKNGQKVEAAVDAKKGRIKLRFEDGVTTAWVASSELVSIVKGGAEELMSRAARLAAEAAAAKKEKELKEKAAAEEKAKKEAEEAARKKEEKRIFDCYKNRAATAFDWCPTGVYFNLDHLPIPDHQKDFYRIVHYEIQEDFDYKRQGKPAYAPDGYGGDRIFFTDGTSTPLPFVTGSKDKVCKGDGPALALIEEFEFLTKELVVKEAFDGGRTLIKRDSYPKEDPAEWEEIDNEHFKGWVRKGVDPYEYSW
jgi:hypothetical protein